jgi:uncharacterized membrane protein YfcA
MNLDPATIKTIMLGLGAGVLGGALGQSGAETMLPGLLILGIVSDFKTAAGTVLLTILPPLSLLAIIEYYKRGQVRVVVSMTLMISYFFAAYFGAYFTKNISNSMLEFISAIYFFIIGSFFLWNSYTGTYGESSNGGVSHTSAFRTLFSNSNSKK